MMDYLFIEDLGREHRTGLRRLGEEIRLLAGAEKSPHPERRGRQSAGFGPLLRGLLENSLGIARTAVRLGNSR